MRDNTHPFEKALLPNGNWQVFQPVSNDAGELIGKRIIYVGMLEDEADRIAFVLNNPQLTTWIREFQEFMRTRTDNPQGSADREKQGEVGPCAICGRPQTECACDVTDATITVRAEPQ